MGIYGFGASAHLAAQIAVFEGATVHVLTRSDEARRHALELGAASASAAEDPPPEPLDAAILFAPAGTVGAGRARRPGPGRHPGDRGIHLSDIPPLHYATHLFQERNIRSVTANTRADGEQFLRPAARIPVRVTTTPFEFSQADTVLSTLERGGMHGAGVLRVSAGGSGCASL